MPAEMPGPGVPRNSAGTRRGVPAEKRSRASRETNHAGTRFACQRVCGDTPGLGSRGLGFSAGLVLIAPRLCFVNRPTCRNISCAPFLNQKPSKNGKFTKYIFLYFLLVPVSGGIVEVRFQKV